MTAALRLMFVALLLAVLGGCATTASKGASEGNAEAEPSTASKIDPWEKWNRKVFAFNDRIDNAVIRPAANTYVKFVPRPVRNGVTNFFGNVSDVWSAFNNFLQGKFADGMEDVMRVGTNTLFGLGGIFDVASELGVDRHNEDLGQTFGRWGMAPGPYVVWPVLGSSTLRDSAALPFDAQISPALFVQGQAGQAAVYGLRIVNTRANLLGATNMLNDIALDRYVFTRDAYLQRRRSLVYDGDPPDEASAPDDSPPDGKPTSSPQSPSAPAAAASSPQR